MMAMNFLDRLNKSIATSKKDSESEGKQFRLAKFFAYASFIVLFLFSFPFSVIVSQNTKDILMKSHEDYALLLGNNVSNQVFEDFIIPAKAKFGQVRLRDKEQYELLDQIIRRTVRGLNIDMVNLYDIRKGVIAYSTDSRLLGKKVKENVGYKTAVNGGNISRVIPEGEDPWGLGVKKVKDEKKLRTFIPFRWVDPVTGERYVGGVFELIQDLSLQYQSIVKFQYITFGLSIIIMALIFVVLLLIVHKAQKIIDQRAREQRDLESQLNQAERLAALGQMCAGVSHEIRNPLGIIRSTAELMGGMPDSHEAQKRLSHVIIEESSRLNNIVTEFLDFARPQEPNFQDCYLEEIIKKNLIFLAPELDKEKIALNHDLNGRSFKLKADPQLLYRAFLNIFVNAIQSIKNGGAITVNVTEKKGHYVVGVEDTGAGINEEDLGKIFNPFFSTKDKGSGLGLSIVRNFIEGHHGSIRLESTEGLGTKVYVRLPKG
jgi:signal transduction histidine kinase